MNYVLKKEDLPKLLELLKKKFGEVIVPAKNETGATAFQPYSGQELFLEARTDFSAKKFFRPEKEKIFSFKKKASSFEVKPSFDKSKRVIFGIRPCGTHALHALDELFIKFFGEDRFYSIRRKNTVVIALQCAKACESGFCTSMGTSQATGYDLLFFERGNDFFVRAETEKGEGILDPKLFKHTSDAEPSQEIECKNELDTKDLGENLYSNFKHPVWKEESERCLSCTACTQSCPTCYCYKTGDEFVFGTDNESERFRLLDSCQLLRFTKVAGNHVFRPSREGRLRQFVLHKLSYYRENHGLHLCVGCGRCIAACPAKISLVDIANRIQNASGIQNANRIQKRPLEASE